MEADNQFGKQRLKDFYIDENFTNLNHGSYGYCPKSVMQYKRQMEEKMQFNTEQWMRIDLQLMINQARKFLAKKVNCYAQNLFIVQNATDAFNGLMKSLTWKAGDIVLVPNIAYACVRKTLEWLRDRYSIVLLDINFTIDTLNSPEKIQRTVEDFVNQYPKKIKCAVFDHISSVPAVVFPIYSIKLFLEEKGIDLFVDGAHAIGQVDIDLMRLDCEAYISNLHKWAFAPKNVAFIYISNKYIKEVRPALTGNFRGQGIDREYFWTGTRDCTSYLCIQKAFEYYDSFGSNAVRNHNHNLVIVGTQRMASIWKTGVMTLDEDNIGYIANVLLPSDDFNLCIQVQTQLMEKHNTYMVVYRFDNKNLTRICAQIYNQLSDYEKTAELFLSILKEKQLNKKFKKIMN